MSALEFHFHSDGITTQYIFSRQSRFFPAHTEILNMCRIKILRAYFIYHSVGWMCVCEIESNANTIMLSLCASILHKTTEIVESFKPPVIYCWYDSYDGGIVIENRIFHLCPSFLLLLLILIHSFEFHELLYVNNFSHLVVRITVNSTLEKFFHSMIDRLLTIPC